MPYGYGRKVSQPTATNYQTNGTSSRRLGFPTETVKRSAKRVEGGGRHRTRRGSQPREGSRDGRKQRREGNPASYCAPTTTIQSSISRCCSSSKHLTRSNPGRVPGLSIRQPPSHGKKLIVGTHAGKIGHPVTQGKKSSYGPDIPEILSIKASRFCLLEISASNLT